MESRATAGKWSSAHEYGLLLFSFKKKKKIAENVVTMRYIFYFCNVKSYGRHEVAANKQRFLCPLHIVNSKRKECGSSNARKVFALDYLTARSALSLCLKN